MQRTNSETSFYLIIILLAIVGGTVVLSGHPIGFLYIIIATILVVVNATKKHVN